MPSHQSRSPRMLMWYSNHEKLADKRYPRPSPSTQQPPKRTRIECHTNKLPLEDRAALCPIQNCPIPKKWIISGARGNEGENHKPCNQWQCNWKNTHITIAHQILGFGAVFLFEKPEINANENAQQKHKNKHQIIGPRKSLQMHDHIGDVLHFDELRWFRLRLEYSSPCAVNKSPNTCRQTHCDREWPPSHINWNEMISFVLSTRRILLAGMTTHTKSTCKSVPRLQFVYETRPNWIITVDVFVVDSSSAIEMAENALANACPSVPECQADVCTILSWTLPIGVRCTIVIFHVQIAFIHSHHFMQPAAASSSNGECVAQWGIR